MLRTSAPLIGALGIGRIEVKTFISHASEDKKAIARPLADALRDRRVDVWYDEYSLKLGDSLRASRVITASGVRVFE